MAEGNQETSGLYRIIIEPTNLCNLDCSMCLRRSWDTEPGLMPQVIFAKLASEIAAFPNPPEILFGGYGEPLMHPQILEMIQQLSALGCRTSLISNGTLLTPKLAASLAGSGLQKLWISFDSSHQEAIANSQANGKTPNLANLVNQIRQTGNGNRDNLELGLSLVLTDLNQTEILSLVELGAELGLKSFFITNLEAYSADQAGLLPYTPLQLRQPGSWRKEKSDLIKSLYQISAKHPELNIEGIFSQQRNRCPFAERGDLVLRWDGSISPCLPLLYGRKTYLGSWDHTQFPYSPGHLRERTLAELWADQDFTQLRAHLLNDEFSPCLSCRDCWLSDDNQQDCMGFSHPTCGGCLWAAGLVNCP